jgi:membrane protease subunit (stomatin/prohibitin family)
MQKGRSGFISSQFIEIIEWIDSASDTIVHKFEDHDSQIKNGAQLIVRESQSAIFLNGGRLADVFPPGRYALNTQNLPILSSLKGWRYGFESPFKADIFFVSTKQFTGFHWGTANPILMRDAEFGVVRLRSFGSFSFRINNAAGFLREIAGTNPTVATEGITANLRSLIVSIFAATLAKSGIPALDLSTKYHELGRMALASAQSQFQQIGVSLTGVTVENISLTEEVEKHIDKKSSMGVIGDLDRYAKFQAADSIPAAMANPGGLAGMGAGMAIGQSLAAALSGTLLSPQTTAASSGTACASCKTSNPANAAFCSKCGKALSHSTSALCPKCHAKLPHGSSFCLSCGTQILPAACTKCGQKAPQGADFCMMCGSKLHN